MSLFWRFGYDAHRHYNVKLPHTPKGLPMKEEAILMMAATILAGYISDERATADERTLKRAADLAIRLHEVVLERMADKAQNKPNIDK